jgi:queuine tRNA-ribosyltransferase
MTSFKVLHKEGKARAGKLTTPHGDILTPNFNPVGTLATVKAIAPKDLDEIGVQMVLANTYHLMLRPGAGVVEKLGGLHKFMGWDKPIMTDSGGYQVFSLGVALEHSSNKWVMREKGIEDARESKDRPRLNKITEEGVMFQSHIDGSSHFLSPEESIKLQYQLGADLIVAFDDHESSKHTHDEMKSSIELTERWELRSLDQYRKLKSNQLMYGVTHGGLHKDLRTRSAKFTDEHFEAIAIGGVYGTKKDLCKIIEWTVDVVSDNKPRHLLGIGEVEDIFEAVERGIDLFDCVAPTRRARNGSLYISPKSGGTRKNSFTTNITSAKYTTDASPLDPTCKCYTCQNFSRAYLRHLIMSKELLYHQLATIHNIYFMNNLVKEIRESIGNGEFKKLKNKWLG